MNMHMPQSDEAEAELRYLANIPNHMISPGSNKPIVGIFQDYMIGSYLFTRSEVKFTRKQAMNLLGRTNARDILSIFDDPSKTTFTNFEILSAILPSISLKYKTKLFQDHEDPANSNHVLEIVGGEYKRGQLNKSVLGSSSVGLIHRIKNDYNADTCKDFIDDIQNIVNEYMLTTGFSVGISDLISNDSTNQEINKVLSQKKSEVNSLIDQTRLSIFKNDTGKPNIEEFETRVNNILGKASSEAGKIGLQTLNKDNRFVALVTSGSKGSELNISQMISCLGQQEVDGKRIPYGYNNRTLPHFKQYDDSPKGRGFVENSFIQGLEPHEVFFHAMGGRVGLIDTAVKTATTGYVQRRLIKGEEDLMVHYDNTVRNNKNKIVQFRYGGTGFDTIYIENIEFKLVDLTIDDIFNEFSFNFNDSRVVNPKLKLYDQSLITKVKNEAEEFMKLQRKTIDMLINYRDTMITKVYRNKNESTIYLPVNFPIMIKSIQKQFGIDVRNVVNITPLTCLKYINEKYDQLEEMFHPCESFRVAYMYYMNPVKLLHHYKLHEDAIAFLLEKIVAVYKKSVVNPGEMVGMVSAQSIGEPCTQMTLNTFHYAGISSKSNVTRGVPRMEELLTLTENLKNPSVTIALKKEYNSDKDMAYKFASEIRHTKLVDVISECEIYFEPSDKHTLIEEDEGLVNDFYTFSNLMNKCLTETIDTISDEDIHGNKPTQTEYNNSKSSNSIKSSIDGGAEEKQEETEDEQTNNWIIRIELDETVMIDNNITCEDIQFALNEHYQDQIKCIYTDYNSDNKLVFRIRLDVDSMIKNTSDFTQEDFIYVVQSFQSKMLEKVIIRGVAGIDRVVLRQELKNKEYNPETSDYEVKDTTYVLDTVGTNLKGVLALDYIDATKTISNDVIEVYNVLGIEAAANCIFQEIRDVIEFDNTYINHHHIQLLVDRMTCNEKMVSIYRHGINKDDIGPIAKASFEETSKMFLQAATHGELDNMRGVSANVMCGQEGYYGTACFNTLMDNDEWFNRMKEMKIAQSNKELEGEDKKYGEQHLGDVDDIDEIMKHLSMAEKDLDMCSINNFVGPDEYDDTVIEADENFMEDEDYELDI